MGNENRPKLKAIRALTNLPSKRTGRRPTNAFTSETARLVRPKTPHTSKVDSKMIVRRAVIDLARGTLPERSVQLTENTYRVLDPWGGEIVGTLEEVANHFVLKSGDPALIAKWTTEQVNRARGTAIQRVDARQDMTISVKVIPVGSVDMKQLKQLREPEWESSSDGSRPS